MPAWWPRTGKLLVEKPAWSRWRFWRYNNCSFKGGKCWQRCRKEEEGGNKFLNVDFLDHFLEHLWLRRTNFSILMYTPTQHIYGFSRWKNRAILRQYWGNIEAILRQYWGNIEESSGVAGRPGLEREYAAGNLPSSWGRCRGCASGRSRAANVYLRSPYMPSHIHSIRGARAMTTIDYQGQWRSSIIMINGMVNDIDHWSSCFKKIICYNVNL